MVWRPCSSSIISNCNAPQLSGLLRMNVKRYDSVRNTIDSCQFYDEVTVVYG